MKVIIPLAGTGDRFVKAGYSDPKPLIKVNGKYIIEYIINMFDPRDEFIFICNKKHLSETNMYSVLKQLCPNSVILEIDNHKKGPVFSVVDSGVLDMIDDNEPVIISYCDNPYLWNYEDFKSKMHQSDGIILSHVGFHPHRLSPTFMAHIDNHGNKVLAIKEKEPYTDKPLLEHASTGTYYFKYGSYIKQYFQKLIDLDIHYNGEYYITLVYNLLIRDNLSVSVYPTEFVTVFGTPEEVQNFEAWQTLLRSTQVKNVYDLINSYYYWVEYNKEVKKQW